MNTKKINKFDLKDGTYFRYAKVGNGPPLILLHTFRNRLEYSNLLIRELKSKHTVFSLDLAGFGDSPINIQTVYSQSFFTDTIVDFINELNLNEVSIAGESIGGILPITIASKIPEKIKKIFCFNPYDYDTKFAEGIRRGNLFSNFILYSISLPLVGKFFSSLENKFILRNILKGGFVDAKKIPEDYLNLLASSTKKNGYVYHFNNVLSNFKTWVDCKNIYSSIKPAIVLVYGESDWSTLKERISTRNKLKLNSLKTLSDCGHFSFLEQPEEVVKIILLD